MCCSPTRSATWASPNCPRAIITLAQRPVPSNMVCSALHGCKTSTTPLLKTRRSCDTAGDNLATYHTCSAPTPHLPALGNVCKRIEVVGKGRRLVLCSNTGCEARLRSCTGLRGRSVYQHVCSRCKQKTYTALAKPDRCSVVDGADGVCYCGSRQSTSRQLQAARLAQVVSLTVTKCHALFIKQNFYI